MPRLDELVDPNAFDAQFSGQPLPDETGEQFLERRKKLGDLGAMGPERLAQGPRDRAQLTDDAARVRGDLAQNAQRDAIENQRRTDAAAKEAQRRTDAEAKAAQTAANAAAKAAQAAQLKQMREAGIVLKTDDTGATVPDTHEDGRVKYKADMIGDPYIDEQTGRPVRKYRDEFGSTSAVDLEQNGDLHTDAQTGSRYYKSPSGLRVDLGPDEHFQKREAVKADLDRLKTEEDLARVELDQHQLATEPLKAKWQEQEKATKELREKLEEAEGLEKSMGNMLPDASKESIKRLRAQWESIKPGYEAAKAELDAATAREREISGGILEKKKRAIEIAADINKLKARSWGSKADVPRIEDRAKSAVEQAQEELKAAQDEARTLSASAKLATTATAGGMTEEQAAALTSAAGAAGKAVNEKIKAAAAKVAHLNKLAGTLTETTSKLESTAKEANARMGAIRKESQLVAADVMLGKLPPEQGQAKLDALDKAMEQARKPVETIEQQRKGAITQIATAFDDPQKWEQSPERGLALAEVERKIAEAQESGTTATEATLDTLKKAPTDTVEGQPIEAQIATLKAELERRNAKTPRPEYTEQIAMLDTALGAKASTEQRRKAADDVVNKIIAQRDGATQKAVFNHGDGVLAGSARIYSEQMKAAQRTWDDPNLNVVSKTLLGLGSSLGANLGAALNLVVGSTEADQIRRAEAKQAQEIIGQLDKDGVKQVLELMPAMEEQWKAGGVVSSEDWNKGGATFSIGLGGVDSGSTLAGVEATIRALEAGDKSTMARVSSELAAGQLLFLKTDGIAIDEKDPVQVAKRAFLRQKLGETVAKQMPNLAAISSGVGSLAAFFEAGGLGRATVGGKALGARAASATGMTIMGADMSFADNPDAMGAMNRFADIAYKSASLAFSEKLGDAFGERITAAMASSPRALSALNKVGLSKPQALGAAKFTGNAVGMTLGETASDVAQNAMDGKNAFEGLRESLMVNGFIGVGMAAFQTATLQRFFGARAAAVASGAGGKPAAGAWQGAMQAHNDARAELDAAEQRADAAEIAIARDKVAETDKALSAMTSQLANVGDATKRGLSAALGAETAAIFPALEENSVLGDAAAAIGAEVRDAYLPGARNEAAAKIVANDPDFTGSNLGDVVINRAIGAMVARDLAAVAEGRSNLTPEKKAALVRLGLIEDLGEFLSAITDSGVALLPSSMRKAILADPSKFGVVATAGSDGRIINGLIAQARDQINTRVTGTTAKQAAAVEAAVQAAANAAPVPKLTPAKGTKTTPKAKEAPKAAPAKQPTFRVEVTTTGKEGTGTLTWEIEADDAAGAEKSVRARAAKMKKTVQGIKVTPLSSVDAGGGPQSEENAFIAPSEPVAGAGSGSSDENTTPPQQQGTPADSEGETPADPAATGEKAPGAVQGPVAKPEKPKKEKKPKAEASPTQKLRTAIAETLGKVLASGKMAKSFGALGVKINREAKMPPVKKNADGTISGEWILAVLDVDGQGNPVYSLDFNVDRAVLLLESLGKPPKEAADYVEASLREELIHFAQYQAIYERWALDGKKGTFMQALKAQYAALWKELTPDQQKAVRELHVSVFEPWKMSAEGVRMIVQLSLDGKTTTTLTEKLKELLRDALDVLQRLAGNPAAQSEHLARTVEDVVQMLARLEAPAADQGQARAEAQRRGDEAAMARMAALGLVENIEGRIRKGKTDSDIAAALQIKDVEGVAAVRAAMKPEPAPVQPTKAIANPDGVPDVAAPEQQRAEDAANGYAQRTVQIESQDRRATQEERQETNREKIAFRQGLKKGDTIIVQSETIDKNGQKNVIQSTWLVTSDNGRFIASPDGAGGLELGLEPDSGMHFFNALSAKIEGGVVVGRSIKIESQSSTSRQSTKESNSAPEKPADVASKEAFQQSVKETNAQAKGKAPMSEGQTKARKLFEGLAADTPRATFEQVPLPAERMAAAADAAATLYTEGVRTPEDMVRTLVQIGEDTGRDLRKYARAFWRFFQGVDFNLQENPDWQAVFDGLSGDGETGRQGEAETGKQGDGEMANPTVSVTNFDSRGRLSAQAEMSAQEAAKMLRGRLAVLRKLKECIHA